MKKPVWQEKVAGLSFMLFVIILFSTIHYDWIRTGGRFSTVTVMFLVMLPFIAGLLLVAWSSEIRHARHRAFMTRRIEEQNRFLVRLKSTYPPSTEVLKHLYDLGYTNVVRYVRELETKVNKPTTPSI